MFKDVLGKREEGESPCRRAREHRELLVDAGWLFLLNACVQYDRGQRETANLSKAAALRIGNEAGHGEIMAWAWEIEAWFALAQSHWQDMLDAVCAVM
ncbi:hypothetical protein [Streptomyces sp. NPDC020747]|uniref:hypothetical protein n=1 Tax=Streptomyces sp. NPDC020747 TaxID=3365086 RepID=UPI0037873494